MRFMQTQNEVRGVIEGWTQEQLSNIHTCIPGKIISYAPKTNRAVVQPTGNFKTADGRAMPYPKIHNAPVYFPMGSDGKSGLTFPIKPGDGCLIVFSESQTTDFLSGEKSDCDDPRRHSLNDAIVLPGLYSSAVPSNIEHSDDVCIFNDVGFLQLNGSEFKGTVAGTEFKFGDGDLVVNGISLVHHVHGEVMSGSSTTGQPQ